jgi:hypothetical protein
MRRFVQFVALIIVMVAVFIGHDEISFRRVHIGMQKAEVEKLLGVPDERANKDALLLRNLPADATCKDQPVTNAAIYRRRIRWALHVYYDDRENVRCTERLFRLIQ